MLYFREKPLYIIKSLKENKKIFYVSENTKDDNNATNHINKKYQKPSYNCFILTKDKKILFCVKKFSFYASYIYCTLQKHNNTKYLDVSKILNSVKNLYFKEFIALVYVYILYFKNQNILFNFLTPEQFQMIINHVDREYIILFETVSFFELIKTNSLFNMKLSNLIYSFLVSFFQFGLTQLKIDNLNLNKSCTHILPGSKIKTITNPSFEIIKNDMFNKLSIKENRDDELLYLDENLQFKIIDDYNKVKPILYMYIYDKVLEHYYIDYTYVLYIDQNARDIQQNFKINNEFVSLVYKDVSFEIDNFNLDTLRLLLLIYKNITY